MNDTASSTPRLRAIGMIILLIVLLMIPNVEWLVLVPLPKVWVQALILPLALLAVFFALLARWTWLACLLLAPFALLAPLEVFYILTYHSPSTTQTLATVLATNPQETIAYVGKLLPVLIAAPLIAFCLALLAAWWSFRAGLRWRGRAPQWLVVIAIATPLASLGLGFALAKGSPTLRLEDGSKPIRILARSITPGFPFGVLPRAETYRSQWAAMRADARRFKNFSFHAVRADPQPHQRQVYVLVIGESSVRGHWQLFGYDRPDNPELSKLSNLIPITEMVTSWPETVAAVPLMLTRKPITSNQPQWKEPSFLSAMQEAGFETWWISNQYPVGRYDSPVAIYAYEAQHVVWVNHTANWDNAGGYDENLIQPLRKTLAASDKDLFIVLHMMGSHISYDYRYPPAFARFKPVESDTRSHVAEYVRIQNSYDNTILYTDHVLAQIIDVLKQSGAVTALWFESDHGELLQSPTCHRNGHGWGTKHEFEIPVLFWYSDAYRKDFPDRVEALRSNANKLTLSADTFSSMVDMAGVTFPGHDESWSLFSPEWHFRTRIVGQNWYTDFDHAKTSNACGVIIPANASSSAH